MHSWWVHGLGEPMRCRVCKKNDFASAGRYHQHVYGCLRRHNLKRGYCRTKNEQNNDNVVIQGRQYKPMDREDFDDISPLDYIDRGVVENVGVFEETSSPHDEAEEEDTGIVELDEAELAKLVKEALAGTDVDSSASMYIDVVAADGTVVTSTSVDSAVTL